MSQTTFCDLCKEIIKPSDKKIIFAYYAVTEEDEDTKKLRFKEVLEAIYEGIAYEDKSIKIVEICNSCAGVFAHFISLRKKELIKSRKEVRRMLARKTKKENKLEDK
jgi:alanine dehydrogenase